MCVWDSLSILLSSVPGHLLPAQGAANSLSPPPRSLARFCRHISIELCKSLCSISTATPISVGGSLSSTYPDRLTSLFLSLAFSLRERMCNTASISAAISTDKSSLVSVKHASKSVGIGCLPMLRHSTAALFLSTRISLSDGSINRLTLSPPKPIWVSPSLSAQISLSLAQRITEENLSLFPLCLIDAKTSR
ncbi:hypothetical protein KP509_09G066100 [Ceratopteris richardii]|uniref:Secreted protein n=1 Tax=Ceratopteris richardii TaxID=49495 RepID=A0A8T2U124_CERRI|nr:hypothetical protein KP509_09G066100 [Ceratopteris richardii]